MLILFSGLAYSFFRKSKEIWRFSALILLFGGCISFGYAVFNSAKESPVTLRQPELSNGRGSWKFNAGDKARIVSRSGSNRVMIRLGSCDSTLTRTVDAGLTVKLIRYSPDCDGFLIADDGNELGWIPGDKLEPVDPAQE